MVVLHWRQVCVDMLADGVIMDGRGCCIAWPTSPPCEIGNDLAWDWSPTTLEMDMNAWIKICMHSLIYDSSKQSSIATN